MGRSPACSQAWLAFKRLYPVCCPQDCFFGLPEPIIKVGKAIARLNHLLGLRCGIDHDEATRESTSVCIST